MAGHTCYHCKEWVEAGAAHDCWTTTESALTAGLSEDLRDAWERLRDTLGDLGEQRIYASHNSIMFARRACYCFVRPKRSALELCFFLGRTVHSPQIRRAVAASARKVAHLVNISHRDQVEAPITEWLLEAYETSDALSARAGRKKAAGKKAPGPKTSPGRKKKTAATGMRQRPRPRKVR